MTYLKIKYYGGASSEVSFDAFISDNSCRIKAYDLDPFILKVDKGEIDLLRILNTITKLTNESTVDGITSIVCTYENNGEFLSRHFERRITPGYEGRKSKKRNKKPILNGAEFKSLEALDKYLNKIICAIDANKSLD